jgi:hypothetical protein
VDEIDEIRPRVAFDVELDAGTQGLEAARDVAHVVWRDVALVRARVHGDASGSSRQADVHGVEDARLAATAGVPQGRHFIHIDRKTNHGIAKSLIANR